MTWSEFIASGSSMDMSNVKNSPNDFIALDNSSAFISNSSLNYYSSDSETVYSSESDMDISFSPPKKRHEAGKRPTSSLAVTLSNSKYSKRLRYTQNITRKEHAHKYEAEQSYSSRYFHTPSTALTTSTSKSFCSESSPSLPPPLPTTLLSTQCTISTRELLNYLKEVFLSSMSVEYLDSNCSIANDKGLHSDPVGKLGKDLSQIVVAPSTFDSCVIHASHFF
ncbi:hypothetical protein HMI55_002454 [Coelomomyces lativittatus]|nr:hypothetical protein HMI55_002454 [Coelomomyces lativittatus]